MSQQVAKIILEQLGGSKFVAMTGAKSLMSSGDERGALSFKLPARFAKDGINYVKVTLTNSDDYTMTFGKVHGLNYKVLRTHCGVYADNLREVFSEFTGLDTRI